MKKVSTKKLVLTGLFVALAVVGSSFSFPVFGSKCSPVQHIANILAGVLLGPSYAVIAAFMASFLRNISGLGSLMAYPGSMIGAFCCGIFYKKTGKLWPALLGEVLGTGVLGGLCAYPVAVFLMGNRRGDLAFYSYILPFLISTGVGALIAGNVLYSLKRTKTLARMQTSLEA